MYKLVIFDMDGTIIDTDLMVVLGWLQLYKKYKPGYIPELSKLLSFSGPSIYDSFAKEFPTLDPKPLVKDFQKISEEIYPTTIVAYPYTREAIEELKRRGVKVSTNTNKLHHFAEYALDLTHLYHLFDSVVGGDDVPEFKPSPLGVYKAMEEAGVKDKKDVLYIGDTIYDYQTALNAGVDCMMVTWSPRKLDKSIKPKYYLDSYQDLIEVLYGK